jgi:voltage-gated sodium channel
VKPSDFAIAGQPMNASDWRWRRRLAGWLEDGRTQRVLIALIIFNAIILGLETSRPLMEAAGSWLIALDRAILAVFVIEITLRLIVHRLAFFRDPWSVFDFSVVAIALIPASGPLAVLRALRVLRVLRLITLVPSMKRVVGGLLAALPGLGSVVAIIGLIFYVAAVVATGLYGPTFPQWFGTLGASAFTLFQIMTLESWAMGVVRPVMAVHPSAWAFFIVFILASTFTLLNLFIAVIVNAIQQENAGHAGSGTEAAAPPAAAELAALRREIAGLRAAMRAHRSRLPATAGRQRRGT